MLLGLNISLTPVNLMRHNLLLLLLGLKLLTREPSFQRANAAWVRLLDMLGWSPVAAAILEYFTVSITIVVPS
jgi:hypothetical protein